MRWEAESAKPNGAPGNAHAVPVAVTHPPVTTVDDQVTAAPVARPAPTPDRLTDCDPGAARVDRTRDRSLLGSGLHHLLDGLGEHRLAGGRGVDTTATR